MAFTYGDAPAATVGDAIRFLIGNTDENATGKNMSDGELDYVLQRYGFTGIADTHTVTEGGDQLRLLQVALEACRAWVAKFATEAHYSIGGMNESANMKAREVRRRCQELEMLVSRAARPRVFGRSKADKITAAGESDLVQSEFVKGMFENTTLDTQ